MKPYWMTKIDEHSAICNCPPCDCVRRATGNFAQLAKKPQEKEISKIDRCEEFLREILKDGMVLESVVAAMIEERGMQYHDFLLARERLGIVREVMYAMPMAKLR